MIKYDIISMSIFTSVALEFRWACHATVGLRRWWGDGNQRATEFPLRHGREPIISLIDIMQFPFSLFVPDRHFCCDESEWRSL